MSLKGLGVRIIHLHFLQSAIYSCSQHSLPIVSVFLLRASINKILWVTLVPPLSAPVFMCGFTCKKYTLWMFVYSFSLWSSLYHFPTIFLQLFVFRGVISVKWLTLLHNTLEIGTEIQTSLCKLNQDHLPITGLEASAKVSIHFIY